MVKNYKVKALPLTLEIDCILEKLGVKREDVWATTLLRDLRVRDDIIFKSIFQNYIHV